MMDSFCAQEGGRPRRARLLTALDIRRAGQRRARRHKLAVLTAVALPVAAIVLGRVFA